jgi:DNA-binding PadR family transcriptional regulator
MTRPATLALNEWAVLAVVVEKPRHGYDIASELDRDSEVGRAWRLGRPLVYRALDRLEEAGCVERRRVEPGDAAPQRTVYGATRKGRAALKRWLHQPVDRLRDVRSELLLKLVLLDRLGFDRRPLVKAQQARFADVFDGYADPPTDDLVARWRHHLARATSEFLDDLR